MKGITIHTSTLTAYSTEVRQYEGRDYLVVPTVMMVEGVHHGSQGPLLYTAEELGQDLLQWNSKPVTLSHPMINNTPVSANLPETFSQRLGYVFNARMEGTKLKAEAWLDLEALTNRSPEALEILNNGSALQVSIGVFSSREETTGDWNGANYTAIATNLRPDHLALLPNEEGACNWDDGCGIRNNSKGGKLNEMNDHKNVTKEVLLNAYPAPLLLVDNETGYQEVMGLLQRQLDRMDSDLAVHYLEEVYNSDVVYCAIGRDNRERKFYRAPYTINEDNTVTIDTDAATHVRRDVSYVGVGEAAPVNSSRESEERTRTKFPNTNTEVNMNKAKSCTVNELIGNTNNSYTEADRSWIENLTEENVLSLTANSKPAESAPAQGADPAQPEGLSINGKTIEETVQGLLTNESNPEAFVDKFFPKELASQVKTGLAVHRATRKRLTDGIVANSDFSAEELEKFDDMALNKLHSNVVKESVEAPVANYSFMGNEQPAPVANTNAVNAGAGAIESMVRIPNEAK
jgi:hypothetical protein